MTKSVLFPGLLPDACERRCFMLSLGVHILAVVLILAWHSIWSWWQLSATDPPTEPASETVVTFAPPTTTPSIPKSLPAMAAQPSESTAAQPLRPRLDRETVHGEGAGSGGGRGETIDLPPRPPAQALAIEQSPASKGGGSPDLDKQIRQEQEANYLLMGLLLRKYISDWKAVYGDRLPRRTIYLWIEHDNSRVTKAAFAEGSSTGIAELDGAIINWLVEANHIDLSDLRQSESRLLMSVDLYQAHR